MTISLLQPVTNSGLNRNAGSAGWRLNQELQATVISSNSRGNLLRIDGDIYTSNAVLNADSGKTLQLKVASTSPFLELALVDGAKLSDKPGMTPAIILSERLLQSSAQKSPIKSSGLTGFIGLLTSESVQSLPPATLALIELLRQKIINSTMLSESSSLKPALQNSSLLIEGTPISDKQGRSGSDLKALLLQIFHSLVGNGPAERMPNPASRPEAYALALYQNTETGNTNQPSAFTSDIEREFLRMFIFQNPALAKTDNLPHRWLLELPVNFSDQIRSVSIRIFEERRGGRVQHAPESAWAAEFSFELANCGQLYVKIMVLTTRVYIAIACDRARTLALCSQNQCLVGDRLEHYGLQLVDFRCTQDAQDISLDFALGNDDSGSARSIDKSRIDSSELQQDDPERNTSVACDANGDIELAQFRMRSGGNDTVAGAPIPDSLYCAMAAFFGYVLDIEDSYF